MFQSKGAFIRERSWNTASLSTPCVSWGNSSSTPMEETSSPSKWRSAKVLTDTQTFHKALYSNVYFPSVSAAGLNNIPLEIKLQTDVLIVYYCPVVIFTSTIVMHLQHSCKIQSLQQIISCRNVCDQLTHGTTPSTSPLQWLRPSTPS